MTALAKYVRLEALALWRERPGDAPREVVAKLGKTTLLIGDLDERPLGHWALAGVVRLGTDGDAVTFSMTADGAETLAIRDREMIEAIAALSRPALAVRPAARRRRHLGLLVTLATLAALAVALPRLIRAEAALLMPPERVSELGDRLLLHLIARGGPPCADPDVARALDTLLAGLSPARVRVIGLGQAQATLLPGGTLLLDRDLVRAGPPEAVAGWAATALASDPLATVLAAVGPGADLRYLLSGHLGDAATAHAAGALVEPLDPGYARIAPKFTPTAAPPLDPAARRALADACR